MEKSRFAGSPSARVGSTKGVVLAGLLKKLLLLLEDHVVVVVVGCSVVEGLVLMLLLLSIAGVSLEVRNFVASVRRLVTRVVEGRLVVLVMNSVDAVTAGGGVSSNSSRIKASSSMVKLLQLYLNFIKTKSKINRNLYQSIALLSSNMKIEILFRTRKRIPKIKQNSFPLR